ncbi:Zinc metalloproteinase nas-7 [Orchesella cincta]|uniref:Zinc metalloproteinase nas-7 n=1 Tax=Orchesella cincta TaxID=48709 RepID=A0A1D2MC96_ORCCI|nr:Zinc metalloproteinase nas-7 [Orchesella cincta]
MKTSVFVVILEALVLKQAVSFPLEISFPPAPQPEDRAMTREMELADKNKTLKCSAIISDGVSTKYSSSKTQARWKELFIYIDSKYRYKEAYINIKKNGTGCSSYVGKVRQSGAQVVSLDTDCLTAGTIIHELIHALGYQSQFGKVGYSDATTFGVPYNTKSIMHYASYDFSVNGKPTIVTKTGKIIGDNNELQWTDITKLRRMYKCNYR